MCFTRRVLSDLLRPGIAPLNLLGRHVALLSLEKPGTGLETPELSWGIVEPMVRVVRPIVQASNAPPRRSNLLGLAAKAWEPWRDALTIVQPDTVVKLQSCQNRFRAAA